MSAEEERLAQFKLKARAVAGSPAYRMADTIWRTFQPQFSQQLGEALAVGDSRGSAPERIAQIKHALWQVESSRLYSAMKPLAGIFDIPERLGIALRCCRQPGLKDEFDVAAYRKTSYRPHGLWEKWPFLHYCFHARECGDDPDRYKALNCSKPTIILFTHRVCRTGAPVLALDLLTRFARTHNVVVFSIGDGSLEGVFRERAAAYVGPIARSDLDFVLWRELRRLKRATIVDYAIVNSIESVEALEAFWKADVPVIHLVHEYAAYAFPHARFVQTALYSDCIIFPAKTVRDDAADKCEQIGRRETTVMAQGVCPPPASQAPEQESQAERHLIQSAFRPPGWPEETVVVLGVGCVEMRKGVHLFLSAAARVRQLAPELPIRFVWIGPGFHAKGYTYSSFVADQLQRMQLAERFAILDEVEELQYAYDRTDIFFLSSTLDPLPLVAQDAFFNKIPLVCFAEASGVPEYVGKDLEASFGVVPYLDIEAAAKKIIALAADPDLRRRVGSAEQRLAAECFDQGRYFTELGRLGAQAGEAKRQEIRDREIIRRAGCLDLDFAYPRYDRLSGTNARAVNEYTTAWRRGFGLRKPFPGFHPGVYADHHGSLKRDPLAHYLEAGCPDGPWTNKVIRAATVGGSKPKPGASKTAVHIHLHYPELAEDILGRIAKWNFEADIFISLNADSSEAIARKAFDRAGLKPASLKVVPNRGRDIGPLITAFPEIVDGGYEFVCHVHGKKSVMIQSEKFAADWAKFLYENLLGGEHPMAAAIVQALQADQAIGLVFPDDPNVCGWDSNWTQAKALAGRMNMQAPLPQGHFNFPVGTMFWARVDAMRPLWALGLGWEDYPWEPLGYDGTMLHALERFLPFVAMQRGYRCAVTHVPGVSR